MSEAVEGPSETQYEAAVVHLSGARLESLIANEATCRDVAAHHLAANRVQAHGSAFGIARGIRIELQRSTVGLAFPREAALHDSQAGVVIAPRIRMQGGRAGLVLAHTVEGKAVGVTASWVGLLIGTLVGVLLGAYLGRWRRSPKSGK